MFGIAFVLTEWLCIVVTSRPDYLNLLAPSLEVKGTPYIKDGFPLKDFQPRLNEQINNRNNRDFGYIRSISQTDGHERMRFI